MRLGFNLLFLQPRATGGTETYARQLLPAIAEARPDAELVAFCGAQLARELGERPWAPGLRAVRLPLTDRGRLLQVAVEQALLPPAARRRRLTLLHDLANTAPLLRPAPSVVTIHDLNHRLGGGGGHARTLALGMRVLVPQAARSTDRIITPSRASRDQVVQMLGVDPEQVDVVPHGPGLESRVTPTPEPELRARLGLGEAPLVLSVSAKRTHKNIARLVEAVLRLDGQPALVVPGYGTGHEDDLQARARALGGGDRVHLLGWVSDADLEGLYRAAACVAVPSLAEGFGLPVLEAMKRGAPVACSETTSLPEVAGDAALLFDPRSVDGMAAAIGRILSDPELRADLARRGAERAARFTWRAAAEATLASYERALASARS